jgi:hypothetical protein
MTVLIITAVAIGIVAFVALVIAAAGEEQERWYKMSPEERESYYRYGRDVSWPYHF